MLPLTKKTFFISVERSLILTIMSFNFNFQELDYINQMTLDLYEDIQTIFFTNGVIPHGFI